MEHPGPHPGLDQRRHDQRQRRRRRTSPPRRAATPRSPGPGPPATPSPSGCRCGSIMQAANDNANVAAITYGPVVLSGNYGNTALSAPARADHLVDHPDQHHRARVHRDRQRLHGQPRPVLRRPRPQLHRLLEHRRRQRHGADATGWSTSAPAWCSASRTCPPPTAAWPCSGATPAPPTTTGRSSPTAPPSGSATSTAARCSAWRTCPPPTTPASCSGPTTAPPTTAGRSSTSGDGTHKIRNVHSGKLLAILNGSTAQGAQAVQDPDNGTADNRWRLVRNT